ncbi:MAG: hypothetical protein KDB25_09300 [Leucobacter sp.]|nr:hypothetical protein [Thermoleophilia bacterium]MCB1274568.1 hypothetical protein [Leucobacter sp.]
MATSPTDPAVLLAITAGGAGAVLLVQARVQSRLLRRRIASGTGTQVIDPPTGLWSSSAAWQCIRAEANRALRLGRPLDVWVGTADDSGVLDRRGRELLFDLPGGSMGIRIDDTRVCVLSCAGSGELPAQARADLQWRSTSLEPGEEAAAGALAFLDGEVGDVA